jgi:hypothetical protein
MLDNYDYISSADVFDDGTELLVSVFWDFIHHYCVLSKPLLFPRTQPTLLDQFDRASRPQIEAGSVELIQQCRFHLMTGEEPSLEM